MTVPEGSEAGQVLEFHVPAAVLEPVAPGPGVTSPAGEQPAADEQAAAEVRSGSGAPAQ